MSKNFNATLSTESEFRQHICRFVGGSAAVTKVFGNGMTVTYVSTGIVNLNWNENPGTYVGSTWGFQASTASALKGYTMVSPAALTANADGTYTLALNITNASDTLADLAALQWATVMVWFKETGI